MFSKSFLIPILVIFCVQLCGGQVIQFGKCAEVTPMQYFDLERFLGEWYEIQRFPHWYERYGYCANIRLQYCEEKVEIEQYYVKDGIQFLLQRNSSYVLGDEAIFWTDSTNIDPIGIPLSVISTDYTNYAVVYGCKYNDVLGVKYLSAWILSRSSSLPEETLRKAQHELTSIPYANIGYLERVEHRKSLCFYHWTAVITAENLTEPMRKQLFSEDGIFTYK